MSSGEAIWLYPSGGDSADFLYAGAPPRLGAEVVWETGRLQVTDKSWVAADTHYPGGIALKVVAGVETALSGDISGEIHRKGRSLAWITLSDKGAQGKRTDESGPLTEQLLREAVSVSLARGFVLPDEKHPLQALLSHLCLFLEVDLILTTGGTGVAPRDVTPEATMGILEKRLPGMERIMTCSSWQKTPHGVISRAAAGTLGHSLIINLPGSPKGVRENLQNLLPAIPHTLDKLQGEPSDCAHP